jgi:ribosomal protein S18 acetylase RimI-like enzyme
LILRQGGPNDVRFLRDMLRHAYYWRDLAEGLPVSRYVDRWGRAGDRAVVALEGMHPVGAAWYRLFPRDAPGYGFVDEETPELTIAVSPARRGKGVGSALLEELLARAREDGYQALSLSVRGDEPARELYERYGFEKVGEDEGAWTMRAQL